jgi:YegS/Rv2252/BmrU family lipid kinase
LTRNTANKVNDQWIAIVNPNAGTKKGEKDWLIISKLLRDNQIRFREFFTKQKGHAITITRDTIAEGHRKYIVIGGDGTLNEVVNGIFNQDIAQTKDFIVGMIPVGTGNDWCRMFNVPFKYKKAVKLIRKQKTFVQDIGKVVYFNSEERKSRHFINVAGMGYDAVVAEKTNRDKSKGRGGPLVYLKNLFTSLLFYQHSKTNIYIDDAEKPISNPTFSLSVGICKYNGGGMMQLPDAIADDGILNMTLIKKLGKFSVLKEVKNLYDGSFVKHPKVDTFKGRKFHITSDPPIQIEVDGESLGHSPFEFEIIPRSLKVITGNSEKT